MSPFLKGVVIMRLPKMACVSYAISGMATNYLIYLLSRLPPAFTQLGLASLRN